MSMSDQTQAQQLKAQGTMTALFHPGLLWKEWRQHRYLLLLLFFLMTLELLFSQLCVQIFSFGNQDPANSGLRLPLLVIKTILQNGMSFTENIAVIAVVLLAAIMLGAERGRSLNYLASTAVSRRQILAAKWLLGNLAIMLCMFGLFLYMYVISALNPLAVPVNLLLLWSLRMTVTLLFLFSLALLSACIFSSILYSTVFTGFFLMLPSLLSYIMVYPLSKYHVLSAMQASLVNQWSNTLDIMAYIGADGGIGTSNGWVFWVSTIILLGANILCLLLARRLFERNPLERNAEVLLSGNSKEVGRLVLALLLAPLWAGNLAGSWPLFLIYLLLLAAAVYLGFGLLWKLMANLGLGRNAV